MRALRRGGADGGSGEEKRKSRGRFAGEVAEQSGGDGDAAARTAGHDGEGLRGADSRRVRHD